ncbi:MAG: DNA polymerase I [Lachnospiraceae bacterium]|nr:DNA polymerase I [Lachnospiraceae bacterium]
MAEKLVLIDGHSILNRAFYGVPDLTNADGLHTNAIYGFLNILFKLLDEEKPDYLAVAFDLSAPTFRHKTYDAYKGTRKPMPEELREQIPVMKEMLQKMGVMIMTQEGYEADDILGTMAYRAQSAGIKVSLVSGDRDLLQVATDDILIRIPKTKSGRTEIEDYYAKDVLEKYKVTPKQFIELKALMGDTSDNIPGVPKVGEKTATELMVTYGSIDEIYAHLDEIKKNSIRESLRENRELADLSLFLATICLDADLPFKVEDAKLGNLFTDEAYELCRKLSFKNMLYRFSKTVVKKSDTAFSAVESEDKLDEVFREAEANEQVAIFFLQEEKSLAAVGLCFNEDVSYCIPVNNMLSEETVLAKVHALMNGRDEEHMLLCFDVKNGFRYTESDKVSSYFDVKLAAYLLNPNHKEYMIEDIGNEFADVDCGDFKAMFGKQTISDLVMTLVGVNPDFVKFVGLRALSVYLSGPVLKDRLEKEGMTKLFKEIEMPLTYVLYDMEREGVLVREQALKDYSILLGEKIDALEKRIYAQVGETFNINSPKQLGEILFEKMGLKGGKKTKTGYSTAADVLEKLAVDNPVVRDILDYRAVSKLKSTYADGLVGYIDSDGRIRTTFNQMVTATGRLSSTDPNLQNIPMRTEMGQQIRKVFVAKEGCVLVDADYSQIELRILAHYSNDAGLIEAYNSDADIHRITAAKVFHVPFEEVTSLMRRNAKAVNFGIVYGISAFGLGQDIGVSQKEAKEYMEQYFETFPGVKKYQEDIVKDAKENTYTTTLFGRKRPMPELASSNFMQRQFGERAAMNAPIQGTAADIMKIAMIRVYHALKDAGLKSKMILQIHDEVVVEAYKEEADMVKEIVVKSMREAVKLAVPLEVGVACGADWLEAHG